MTPEQQDNLLLDSNEYLKSGIHIGTKFKTKYMADFIYKTRPDGLSVLNLKKIDERLRLAINFLSQYAPEDILILCRRENGWKGLKKLHELTGIPVITGRYPPGILTNPNLETFAQPKVVMVCDPWPDRNVVEDAGKVGTPVVALCDTNNQSNKIDLVIPCNNKGKKSVGLVFFVLAREFMQKKGLLAGNEEMPAKIEDFVEA
ncbi:TPA: 30S ribosomal protein S2 [Candidatus Woesearchaeota archaeon]|nr:30S ribosomal protein S2 [archaeon]HIJ12059.1 30S ribosomal protein S2 [Candidatus Woesearchaeota archaeon]